MGRKYDELEVQTDIRNLPCRVLHEGNKPKFLINSAILAPEAISSMILAKLKYTDEAFLKQPVKVVSV